jgi:hypothetical protein
LTEGRGDKGGGKKTKKEKSASVFASADDYEHLINSDQQKMMRAEREREKRERRGDSGRRQPKVRDSLEHLLFSSFLSFYFHFFHLTIFLSSSFCREEEVNTSGRETTERADRRPSDHDRDVLTDFKLSLTPSILRHLTVCLFQKPHMFVR